MKLIIDIDDNVFTRLFDNGVDTSSKDRKVIDRAVRNGTPYEERPTGHWIEEPSKLPHCSECGTYSDDADREDGGFYCTHCGAKMEVEND